MANVFFQYIPRTTFLHKIPPVPKIILMVALAILAFYCPLIPALIALALILLFSKIALRLSFSSILADLRPIFAYISLIYISSIITNIYTLASNAGGGSETPLKKLLYILYPSLASLSLLVRITLSLQISSVFYRTTSSSQFYEGFSSIEHALTRKETTPLADTLSLTLTFIPRIASFWEQIDTAYRARGGKKGIRRILCLVPVLFRVSMHEAYQKTLARENRMD